MPPKKPAAPALTRAQNRRYTLMRSKGVTQKDIADHLAKRGVILTRQTVNYTIRNRSVNEDVIDAFCKLTDTTRKQAWPDVPDEDERAARTG